MTVSDTSRDSDIVEGDELDHDTLKPESQSMDQLSISSIPSGEKMLVLRELSHGDYFGEKSLLREERRSANVISITNVEV